MPPTRQQSPDPGAPVRWWLPFSREELPRLARIYATVAALNAAGWSAFWYYHNRFGPLYAAAGSAAFVFGLRHAFDADHISAIDDTTRYLMQRGKRPLGVGLFFSLGHSTIVMGLTMTVAFAAQSVQRHLPGLQKVGGTISASVSGTFLLLIGVLDFIILRGIVDVWHKTKTGNYTREELDDLLAQRGFLNRILGSRWRRFVSDSWQMYPIGVLFGLGFDTASQVALIGLTAATATSGAPGGHGGHIPLVAVIALPLLFAGGMTFMDTTNGVVMTRAYSWAFTNPLRKVYYNMATVGLGVFVALGVGMVEYLQVFSAHAGLKGSFWAFLAGLNFEVLGYFIVGTFVLVWIGSMLAYKLFRFEDKYGGRVEPPPAPAPGVGLAVPAPDASPAPDPENALAPDSAGAAAESPEERRHVVGLVRRPVLRLGRAVRGRVAATSAVALAVTGANVGQALLIAHLLVAAFRGHFRPSVPLLAGLAGLILTRAALVRLLERQATVTAGALRKDLRRRLYARLAVLGPAYGLHHRTGEVQATVLDGVDTLGAYFGRFLPLLVTAATTVVAVVAAIAVFDPVTGAVVLAAALVVPAAPVITEKAFGQAGRRFWARFGQLSAGYLDAIQGMTTLRVFNAQRRWGDQLLDQSRDLCEDAIGLNSLASMHIGFVALGMGAGTAGAVAVAALRVTQSDIGLVAGITIVLLARECFRPLAELSAALPRAYLAVSAATAVNDLLNAQPDVVEADHPVVVDRRTLVPSLAFEEVTFSYQPDHRPALLGLSFRVDAGETVALVGRSGAGKSTVVSLLLRFFDPQSGRIRVAGHDVADIAIAQLRDLIAVSFQDTYLFHRSVADNLRLGRPEASDADLEWAARHAHAHAFIRQLPDGYATVVGERGLRLSGGERQRLAIARALLADRPFLVLDEPTSSVDGESEALIQHALERLTAERTTLIIAHRLSTVESADRVVVLDEGRVVETGTPAQLVAADGAYRRLVQAQELT